MESPRIKTRATHGTGCILSASIAAALAHGNSLRDAVIEAKTYLNYVLKNSTEIGKGFGPAQFHIPKHAYDDVYSHITNKNSFYYPNII